MDIAVSGNTVRLSGTGDAGSADQLVRELGAMLGEGITEIVIDAGELVFAGSAVVRVLVRAARSLQHRHGHVRMENASAVVAYIMELTGADQAVEVGRADPVS